MASLRQSYEDWINNDPEEVEDETDDEAMAKFAEEEARHKIQFEGIAQNASKFSSSLGVIKLSDEEKLSPALVGFMKEGIRFSFSNSDELVIGTRLTFLSILIKYAQWIKRNPDHKHTIREFLDGKEIDLKNQESFDDIYEDDLACLLDFRAALGLEESSILGSDDSINGGSTSQRTSLTPHTSVTPRSHMESVSLSDDDESRDTVNNLTNAGTSVAHKSSRGSSVGSIRSMISSVRNSLSPLYEEGDEDDSEQTATSTPAKIKRSRPDESVVSSAISKGSILEDSIDSRQSNDYNSTPGRSKRGRPDESVVSSAMSKGSILEDSIDSSNKSEHDFPHSGGSPTQTTFDGEQSE